MAAKQNDDSLMAGYLIVPNERVSESYDAGFSMYVAAWPLLRECPGNRFQTGLFGTWMFAQQEESKPEERVYSDIEGDWAGGGTHASPPLVPLRRPTRTAERRLDRAGAGSSTGTCRGDPPALEQRT